MRFAAYMAVLFITFFHILLVLFCVTVHIIECFVCFCLILYKLSLKYTYCYVYSVLGILLHCFVPCIICV